MSAYHNYTPDISKLVVLSFVDEFLYCYTYEEVGEWFVGTCGKILNVNFLGYAHLFMSISISQIKDHSISVDQARYATYVVEKYLVTDTIKVN